MRSACHVRWLASLGLSLSEESSLLFCPVVLCHSLTVTGPRLRRTILARKQTNICSPLWFRLVWASSCHMINALPLNKFLIRLLTSTRQRSANSISLPASTHGFNQHCNSVTVGPTALTQRLGTLADLLLPN